MKKTNLLRRFVVPFVGSLLMATTAIAEDSEFTAEGITALLKKVNTYTVEHPHRETDRGWIRGTYYTGVMGAYDATGDAEYLEQAKAWGEKHEWQVGTDWPGANRLFCVMTWLELYFKEPDPKKLEKVIAWLAKADDPASPGCGEIWYGHGGGHREVLYADSLYGAPALAMLHTATGEQQYLDILNEFFWPVTDAVFDKDDHLYYRDDNFNNLRRPNGRKYFWSRGNGWVFAGIPRVLKYLPKDDPTYDRYVDLYKKMAVALLDCQHDDGFWRSNLGDDTEYLMPESSGTAFFTYGLAAGINAGLLDRDTYLPAVIKGWSCLVSAIHPNGNMGWVQPVDLKPRPSLPVTTHEYASGLFMLAGGEMLKLIEQGLVSPEVAAQYVVDDALMLPSSALKKEAFTAHDHPLATEMNAFLKRQTKAKGVSTELTKKDYLKVIAGQVAAMRKYQDEAGRIIDPVVSKEMYYTTPCYAHSVAVLASSEYLKDEAAIESGMKALDHSLQVLSDGKAPGGHGDFFTWPVMLAYELFKPLASETRQSKWAELIAAIAPEKSYRVYTKPYKAYEHKALYANYGKTGNNWNLVNTAGEFLRHQSGFTDLEYVDFSMTMQLARFTPYGMYNEGGNPLAYDLFARHYLTGMLHRGYRSFVYTTYRDLLWKGAWTSLFMQSPTGELPTGYRSSHHIWNEAEQTVLFEIYAAEYAKAGKLKEAGAFKRAAHLALGSIKEWIREDGSGYVVKNRFPKEKRHGHETYSQHSCYNMLACSMLAQAWQFADETVEELAAPADVGGFAFFLPGFHKIFANAGGTYIEYDTDGDQKYNPTGLIRVHLKNGHPQLGPSDGCASLYSGKGNAFAVGPAWKSTEGTFPKLATLKGVVPEIEVLKAKPKKVQLKISYTVPEDMTVVSELITLKSNQVTIEDRVEGAEALRIYYPMLVSDGKKPVEIAMDDQSVSLSLNDKTNVFEIIKAPGAKLMRSEDQLGHRNGIVEPIYFETENSSAKYRIICP